jgi:hypothetical protein
VARVVLLVLLLALVFLLGIAFARTLDERPRTGRSVTSIRTLAPLPEKAAPSTVTTTVTAP